MLGAWLNRVWPVVRSTTIALVCEPVCQRPPSIARVSALWAAEGGCAPATAAVPASRARIAPRVAKNNRIGGYNRRRGAK